MFIIISINLVKNTQLNSSLVMKGYSFNKYFYNNKIITQQLVGI